MVSRTVFFVRPVRADVANFAPRINTTATIDETLARIVELTPDAEHLTGEGLTSGRIGEQTVAAWLRNIGIIK